MPTTTSIRLSVATVDLDRREIVRDGAVLPLTELEAALLARLADPPNTPVTREELLIEVWGFPKPVATRAVDNTVHRLRPKIERDPNQPDHLRTVRGRGYVLELPEAPARGAAAPNRPPAIATPPARLAVPPTDFHGRHDVLAAVGARLAAGARLVVLTGLGGAGKTRLVARWVDRTDMPVIAALALADAGTAADLVDAVGAALGVAPPDRSPAVVGEALAAAAPGVLVLDNLEQLVDALPATLSRWLRRVPGLQVVATSRVPLALHGEHRVDVGGLTPRAAMALFASRLRAHGHPAITDDERPGVRALLARLGHHPLSLELIAARARAVPLHRLVDTHADPLRLAAGGPRDGVPRHHALADVLRDTWDLMDPACRPAFAACGVFAGPFDLDAAEVALADAALDPLDGLAALIDASLVHRDGDLYRMLPPIRRFAVARLDALDGASAIRARIARFLVTRVGRLERAIQYTDADAAMGALRHDQAHLLALAPALEAIDAGLASAALVASGAAHLGSIGPEDRRFERAVALAAEADDPTAEAEARTLLAMWCMGLGDVAGAVRALEPVKDAALAGALPPTVARTVAGAWQLTGDTATALRALDAVEASPASTPPLLAAARCERGMVLVRQGRRDDAAAVLEAAIRYAEAEGLRSHASNGRSALAVARSGPPERDAACQALLERAVADADPALDPGMAAWMMSAAAFLALARGDLDAAAQWIARAEATLPPWSYASYRRQIWATRAYLADVQGDLAQAEAHARRALELVGDAGSPRVRATRTAALAGVRAAGGHVDEATALLDALGPSNPTASHEVVLQRGRVEACAALARGEPAAALRAVAERRAQVGERRHDTLTLRIVDRCIDAQLARAGLAPAE